MTLRSTSQSLVYSVVGPRIYHFRFIFYLHSQFSSVAQSCLTHCDPMDCSTPGFPVHHQLPETTQTLVHCIDDPIQPSYPLSFPSPPAFNLSQNQVFSNESVLHIRWPKYWSFRFNISPSNEYSGLIFFRMNWLDLLTVQGTLRSLLQHYSSKTSILWHSAFFIVQLSHPYLSTGKTIALTRWTFVGKVTSLLFHMLSRLVMHSAAAAAAAAKSLQLCPILWDPRDGSPPGSPIPGILQARTLEWVAFSFSNAWKWKVKVKSFSHVWLLVTPWTAAYQAPPSMGFAREEYWSGLPLPSPGHTF